MSHRDSFPASGAAGRRRGSSGSGRPKRPRKTRAEPPHPVNGLPSGTDWEACAAQFSLTAEEVECARLACEGRTPRQVARGLRAPLARTRRWLASIYDKLLRHDGQGLLLKGIADFLQGRAGTHGGHVNGSAPALVPRWDAARRELWFGGVLVKKFRRTAPNQFRILDLFEQLGWPQCIDDPLPPDFDLVSTVRLHDAINGLNRRMTRPLIRFGGDGSGTGVTWWVVDARRAADA